MIQRPVYRVEDGEGLGPYIGNYDAPWVDAHTNSSTHPNLYGDKLCDFFEFPNHLFCGFATPQMLLDWFDGFGTQLADNGFMAVSYLADTETLRYGTYQLVFEKATATKVDCPLDIRTV